MLAFTVNDTKSFMNLLLKGDTFDAFSFRQGELTTFASFIIEGKRNMDFYTAEEQEAGLSRYVHWEEMRPFVFQAIKGNKLPKSIKLVFSLAEEKLSNLPNTKAAFLNILFKEHTILCTTAISQEAFSLDKSSISAILRAALGGLYFKVFQKKRHWHPEAGELISFFFPLNLLALIFIEC